MGPQATLPVPPSMSPEMGWKEDVIIRVLKTEAGSKGNKIGVSIDKATLRESVRAAFAMDAVGHNYQLESHASHMSHLDCT